MAKMPILTFPDPRLREIAQPVKAFGPELKKLTEDMLETMYDANGIGLAAPQVGVLDRVLVIDTRPREEKARRYKNDDQTELESKIPQPLVLINPVIVKGEGKTTFDEGCLSIPGYFETVERFNEVTIEYQDVTGAKQTLKTDGLLAICCQHEMDHLEGTLFVDHLSFLKSKRIKEQIKKHGYPSKDRKQDEESEKETEKEKVR